MNAPWLLALSVLSAINLALLVHLWWRTCFAPPPDLNPIRPLFDAVTADIRRLEESLRTEFSRDREEASRGAAALRDEMGTGLRAGFEGFQARQEDGKRSADQRLDNIGETLTHRLQAFGDSSDQRLSRLRQELNDAAIQARGESRSG